MFDPERIIEVDFRALLEQSTMDIEIIFCYRSCMNDVRRRKSCFCAIQRYMMNVVTYVHIYIECRFFLRTHSDEELVQRQHSQEEVTSNTDCSVAQ